MRGLKSACGEGLLGFAKKEVPITCIQSVIHTAINDIEIPGGASNEQSKSIFPK